MPDHVCRSVLDAVLTIGPPGRVGRAKSEVVRLVERLPRRRDIGFGQDTRPVLDPNALQLPGALPEQGSPEVEGNGSKHAPETRRPHFPGARCRTIRDMVHIRGRGFKTRLRGARKRVVAGLQEGTVSAVGGRIQNSNALGGKLRPGLLSALTPIAASHGDPTYLFSTRDREIGWSTYREQGFDEHKSDWVVARVGNAQKDRTVLDIGANIGTVAIPMVTKYGAARAVALEPEPLNFKLLRCNTVLNGVEDRVVCIPVAASDQEGEVEFELSESNYGDHRIRVASLQQTEQMSESQRATITVQAVPLSKVLQDANITRDEIGLVWVDTQGHEAQVLSGMGDLTSIPLVVEYWPYGLRRADGLELFHGQVARFFSQVIDIKASIEAGRDVAYAASDIERVGMLMSDPRNHTDLLLLP
jgi:FkbM family methyltransferase